MVGLVQRDAERLNARRGNVRPVNEDTAGHDTTQLKPHKAAKTSTNLQPATPPLPLDAEETALCALLTGVLATPPRRSPCEQPPKQAEISDRIPRPADVVPEQAELPPLPTLPLTDPETGAPAIRSIAWLKRSRQQRLKSALSYSAAWLVTLGVIAATICGTSIAVLGFDKSAHLSATALMQGVAWISASAEVLKRLTGF